MIDAEAAAKVAKSGNALLLTEENGVSCWDVSVFESQALASPLQVASFTETRLRTAHRVRRRGNDRSRWLTPIWWDRRRSWR